MQDGIVVVEFVVYPEFHAEDVEEYREGHYQIKKCGDGDVVVHIKDGHEEYDCQENRGSYNACKIRHENVVEKEQHEAKFEYPGKSEVNLFGSSPLGKVILQTLMTLHSNPYVCKGNLYI